MREATRDLPFGAEPPAFLVALEDLAERGEDECMSPPELLTWSLAELAQRLRQGEVSSREATLAVLAALEETAAGLNAVARLEPERALRAADAADRLRADGGELGLLHGVPLAHKDMFYRAGELAECGARLMRGHRPDVTATVLRRLDAAGAIDVGRLNMVEFALGITGHNAHTGHPRNPWDTSQDHRRLDQRRRRGGGGAACCPRRWARTPAARSATPPRPAASSA